MHGPTYSVGRWHVGGRSLLVALARRPADRVLVCLGGVPWTRPDFHPPRGMPQATATPRVDVTIQCGKGLT